MSAAEDSLSAAKLEEALRGCVIGREILVLDETTSTNDVVFSLSKPDTPEGLVVFAERQTSGRGQHGNQWESAAGRGLWFSILLRPQIADRDLPRLTTCAAETVALILRQELSLGARVKPPNDVYIDGRKVAGVLLERRGHSAILGIGINVNHEAADFPEALRERAGSLKIALGRAVDRHALAVAVLRELDRTYGVAADVAL